jgi:hypothetical protein
MGVKERGVKVRLMLPLGLLAGAAGAFFVPALLGPQAPFQEWYTRGLPELDMALFGLAGHGHPVFYSGLIPLVLTIVGYGLRPTRALAIGLSLGVAANLAFTALWGTVEIHWVPSGLETIWLLGNAAALAILARVCLKK